MNDFISPSNIALGGILAAAVAGWSHVKTFLSYLASFAIVTANLDDGNIDYAVVMHLKKNWRRLPTGRLKYDSLYLKFKDGLCRFVPFRSITSPSIFVSKRGMVLLTKNQLTTFRFVTDLDLLVKSALQEFEDTNRDANAQRFMVIQCMGSEKTLAVAAVDHRSGRDNAEVSTSDSSPVVSNSAWGPIQRVDKSFMYDEDLIDYHSIKQDPLEGLFYDQQVLSHLEAAKIWKSKERWYAERGLPHRRGTLIYGPGGTGKSSLALATAKALNVPLYSFLLSTMSDQEFIREWQRLSAPCVVLFEDFDTIFNKRTPLTEHKSLTFDCVINQISGVKNLNGIYLIVTTNNLDAIDPAMGVVSQNGSISTRPGRLDTVLYLGPASVSQRERMAKHILRDWPECFDDMVAKGEGMTPAQFQELCIQFAFTRMSDNASIDVPFRERRVVEHTNQTDSPVLV